LNQRFKGLSGAVYGIKRVILSTLCDKYLFKQVNILISTTLNSFQDFNDVEISTFLRLTSKLVPFGPKNLASQ